jgi:hypothetical protein
LPHHDHVNVIEMVQSWNVLAATDWAVILWLPPWSKKPVLGFQKIVVVNPAAVHCDWILDRLPVSADWPTNVGTGPQVGGELTVRLLDVAFDPFAFVAVSVTV